MGGWIFWLGYGGDAVWWRRNGAGVQLVVMVISIGLVCVALE